MNVMAMSAFHSSDADLRWDDPSTIDRGPEVIDSPAPTTAVTVIVVGEPTLATPAGGSFEVVAGPIADGEGVAIDGVLIAATSGPVGADEFDGQSTNIVTLATRIADAINAGSPYSWGLVEATASGSTVSITSRGTGDEANTISLASTSSRVVASSATLSGGAPLSQVTVNGITLSAVDGARTSGSRDFDLNDPGDSLTEAINDPANGVTRVSASWDGGCIKISALVAGVEGNGIPVSSNTFQLSVSNATTQGGTGLPCPNTGSNSKWDIVGVNIYRSDTGERGPYYRVNRVIVGGQFYRDRTDVVEVPLEVIPWNGGWVFRGDAPNRRTWRLKTRYTPMVKQFGNAVHADSEFDVEVYVDGARVPVAQVFGPTGEVDIAIEKVWDPAIEDWVQTPIPDENSHVTIRYFYRRNNKLQNTLDRRFKVFYRVATVAVDPGGTSPSGLVETPLEYCPPVSPMESEELDYIWKEAIRRNRWILEQGGERVKLFIRRTVGNRCQCVWDARLEEYSKQPLNNCLSCYGTGWVGGYEGPYDIIIGPDESERRVSQTPNGRRLENSYEVWIGPTPIVSQRDFIVKQNGERFSIGAVRRTQVRGRTLQQAFTVGYLDMGDIRYQVPMGELERLPWPQTRFTNPELAPCEDAPPYPVGSEYQAAPMATEKTAIPDGREQRGRTPVWQNITYGGKGR